MADNAPQVNAPKADSKEEELISPSKFLGQNAAALKPKIIKKKKKFSFGSRVGLTDKMFFARYLALMLRSGIPLTRALEFLQVQMESQIFRKAIADINRNITSGVTIADSLASFPNIFDNLFINMVRSGEAGGNLSEVLDIIAEELEKANSLRSKVVGAMIYPLIIIGMMMGVSSFIVLFVFPKIITIYQALNVKLPLATRVLVVVVKFSTANSVYIGAGALAFVIGLAFWVRTKKGKRQFDWLVLRAPVLKNIVRKINSVQFARTFSSLLKSGISTPQALEIVATTFGNSFYKDSARMMVASVRQGKRIGDVLMNLAIYPPIVGQMVSVGEETGELSEILKKLSQFFEAEVDQTIDNLTKIIEPFLMIIIGAIVGFVAIATVQLIYSALQGVS